MRRLISLLLTIVYSSTAFAGWEVVSKKDDFTDEMRSYAAYNDNDHRVQLSREGDGVWMFITRKKIGTIEPSGLIELRVDENKLRIIDPHKAKMLAKMLGKETFQWEPTTVGFLLWHGKEDEGCGYINELNSGKELKVRYQTSKMSHEIFKVGLGGAKNAIAKSLALNVCK